MKKIIASAIFALAFVVTATASAAYDFGPSTLKVGSKGEYVKTLQTLVGANADGDFGQMTKAKVMAWQASNGLVADGMFGNASKAKANSMTTTTTTTTTTTGTTGTTTLSGGAGELNLTTTSSNVEDKVKEDSSEKVLAWKGEADGSDIAVTSVKLVFANTTTGSEKLTDYVEEVKVYLGSKEVGSADASDFSRDSGSPDVYSKTISLSNAVVEEGEKETFYVEVTTGSIDTDDQGADWTVALDAVRYTDSTGVVLSDSNLDAEDTVDATGGYDETFTFDDASTDDNIAIKTLSSDPDTATFEVKTDDVSDEYLVGAFKFDVDEDSSDITINELPIVVTFAGSATSAGSADSIIDTLTVKIDGKSYEADLGTDNVSDNDGTALYTVEFEDDELVIDAGETMDVKIYAEFNSQEGNYSSGTTFALDVDSNDIDAEGNDDLEDGNLDGSYSGDTHTLSVDAPMFDLTKVTFTTSQSIDGVATGEEDVFLAEFVFNVTAPEDQDIYLSSDADDITATQIATGNIDSIVLDSSDVDEDNLAYLISSGETEEFTVSVYVRGANASEKITLTGFMYGIDDGASADDLSVTSGLTDFKTTSKYLAK